jgi:predicted heme/steroid binding protein
MPLTNWPGGISALGFPAFPGSVYDVPQGNVWFVNNSRTQALQASGDGTSRDRAFVSLADAIAKIATTNPTKGDWIVVGAGHTENVTASNVFGNSLVNTGAVVIPEGTRIIGEGTGNDRPTFTFTAAASTIALANPCCTLENLQLLCPQAGTVTTAAMVTVTAQGCAVRACMFQGSSSATALVTTGISLSSGANFFSALDNTGFTVTGAPTSWLSTTGTAGPAHMVVLRNTINWILSATGGGVIDVSANSVSGPIDVLWTDNNLGNLKAASTVVILGCATLQGEAAFNFLTTLAAAAATAITTPGLLTMYTGNQVCQQGKQAIAITVGGNST